MADDHPSSDDTEVWTGPTRDLPQEETALSSRYKAAGKLGEGGMAIVHAAEDLQLDRTVAVKCMRPRLQEDPAARRRFTEEAKILAQMSQHGTVAIYDLTTDGAAPFYAMERVEGKTLGDLLRARTDEEIGSREQIVHFVDVFERVCRTMAYAHAKGVVHRDLKPANVMVDDEFGTVHVMDWGLAKRGDEKESEVCGTPGYMSPEQMQGDRTGFPSDVFALGVMLYQILTGKKPFEGRTRHELLQEMASPKLTPPIAVNRRAGRELSAICMKALERSPAARYPTAQELAADLRRFREFRPVSVVDPTLRERLGYWVRRHRIASAVLGTLAAATLVVAAIAGIERLAEARLVRLGLGMIDESLAEVHRLEATLATASPEETPDLRARLAAAHLALRGRLAAVLGLTIASPHPRVIEIGRWQALRLVEMMIEFENYPMARALAQASLAQAAERNFLQLSEKDLARLRELSQVSSPP